MKETIKSQWYIILQGHLYAGLYRRQHMGTLYRRQHMGTLYRTQRIVTLYRTQHMETLIKMITTGSGTIQITFQ